MVVFGRAGRAGDHKLLAAQLVEPCEASRYPTRQHYARTCTCTNVDVRARSYQQRPLSTLPLHVSLFLRLAECATTWRLDHKRVARLHVHCPAVAQLLHIAARSDDVVVAGGTLATPLQHNNDRPTAATNNRIRVNARQPGTHARLAAHIRTSHATPTATASQTKPKRTDGRIVHRPTYLQAERRHGPVVGQNLRLHLFLEPNGAPNAVTATVATLATGPTADRELGERDRVSKLQHLRVGEPSVGHV